MATINKNKMPIIKNIGYMWQRKYVNWQSGRELMGYPEIRKGEGVNFADQAGIYMLYDRNLQCVYVGQVGKKDKGLFDRLKDHTEDHLFCVWERFSWFGFYTKKALEKGTSKAFTEEYEIITNVDELMNVIESFIIRSCRPSFNQSWGCLFNENSDEYIEWYYQEAEWEEQAEEFKRLQKICQSLRKSDI